MAFYRPISTTKFQRIHEKNTSHRKFSNSGIRNTTNLAFSSDGDRRKDFSSTIYVLVLGIGGAAAFYLCMLSYNI